MGGSELPSAISRHRNLHLQEATVHHRRSSFKHSSYHLNLNIVVVSAKKIRTNRTHQVAPTHRRINRTTKTQTKNKSHPNGTEIAKICKRPPFSADPFSSPSPRSAAPKMQPLSGTDPESADRCGSRAINQGSFFVATFELTVPVPLLKRKGGGRVLHSRPVVGRAIFKSAWGSGGELGEFLGGLVEKVAVREKGGVCNFCIKKGKINRNTRFQCSKFMKQRLACTNCLCKLEKLNYFERTEQSACLAKVKISQTVNRKITRKATFLRYYIYYLKKAIQYTRQSRMDITSVRKSFLVWLAQIAKWKNKHNCTKR